MIGHLQCDFFNPIQFNFAAQPDPEVIPNIGWSNIGINSYYIRNHNLGLLKLKLFPTAISLFFTNYFSQKEIRVPLHLENFHEHPFRKKTCLSMHEHLCPGITSSNDAIQL